MGWGTIRVSLAGEGTNTPSVTFGTPGFTDGDGQRVPSKFFSNKDGAACFEVALTEKNLALAKSEAAPRGWVVSVEPSDFAKSLFAPQSEPVKGGPADVVVVEEENDEQPRPQRGRPRKNKES